MRCLRDIIIVLVVLITAPTLVAGEPDYAAALRYLSTVIRDVLPSSSEARALNESSNKDATLDELVSSWLESPEHADRVRRHFNDMLGIEPFIFLADHAFDLTLYDGTGTSKPGDLAAANVWYLPTDIKATCGTPTTVNAWWSDTPISVCSTAVSSVINPTGRWCADPFGTNGIRHADCGCGPEQVLCFPAAQKKRELAAVAREFQDRAQSAYATGMSWSDLFGGNKLFGDRYLYHFYLYSERITVAGTSPTAAEMTLLKSLPVDGTKAWITLPASGGPERAGVATSPAFMMRFNNFRSRIRAITEHLLCQDIDPGLNTSGIATFVNPDLSDFDLQHGTKADCAGCHYALDNFGSTLLGWDDRGFYQAWAPKSQLGHVFGEDGTGPRFLMTGYIERAPGFLSCMAKKTWEGFSGLSWEDLGEADRAAFVSAAPGGPRAMIREVLLSKVMRELRINRPTTVTTTVPVTYSWVADIAPLAAASCAGSTCHSSGNPRGQASAYAESEVLFRTVDASRIANGSMPPAGSGRTLSTADRDKLLIFLSK